MDMGEEFIEFHNEINPRSAEALPLDWNQIFRRTAPLVVEVGCGNGEYLISEAGRYPGKNFIGIELSLASAQRAQRRIHRGKLPNVRIMRDDAKFALREIFPENSLSEVIMNFPDPWPRTRHKNRRLISPEFAGVLAGVLEMGGKFELYTDQGWYTDDTRAVFLNTEFFHCSDIVTDPERSGSTKYERKWREENRTIFYFTAVKKRDQDLNRIVENRIMPHFFIRKKLKVDDIRKLIGFSIHRGESVFTIKEVFQSPDKEAYLLRTAAVDRDYLQIFFILVARHERDFIVKIDSGFQPYRTPAVRLAVEETSRFLERS